MPEPIIEKEAAKPKVEEFSIKDFETIQLPTKTEPKAEDLEPKRTDTSAAEKLAKEQAGTKQGIDKTPANSEEGKPAEVEVQKGGEEKKDEAKLEEKKDDITRFLKKPGEKKEDKVEATKKEEVKKEETKATIPKITRDYSQYSPEEVTVFKQMSDSAYEFTTKAIKKVKELEQLNSKSYLQHENAFLLDPSFHELTNKIRSANTEAQVYREQLQAIDKGQKVGLLKGFDSKTGEPVFDQLLEPNSALTEEIRMRLMKTTSFVDQARGAMNEYPKRYQQGIQHDLGVIEQERKARFAWANNPEMMDYQIEIPGLGARSLKQVREDMSNVYPVYMRSHPAVGITGDLMIALRIAQAEINELKSGKQVEQIKEEEARLVEPTSNAKQVDKGNGKYRVKEFHALPSDLR